MKYIGLFALALLVSITSIAQYPDNIHNQELRSWLKSNTYDGDFDDLGYNQARIQMYSYTDEVDGKIECVYTGFQQNAESTTYLDPINAEHIVPQSFFGSQSPMKSDIYNLRPTHQNANSERGNLGFDEVPDASATWYGVSSNNAYTSSNTEPNPNDLYSERGGGDWEPREDRKGDVARQVFYFYTMYPTQAGSIAGLASIDQLYEWHMIDPVTADEMTRNDRIEEVQGNRNPYVDYDELVYDAWLWEIPEFIAEASDQIRLLVYPNPIDKSQLLQIEAQAGLTIELFDAYGKIIVSETLAADQLSLHLEEYSAGMYWVILKKEGVPLKSKRIILN